MFADLYEKLIVGALVVLLFVAVGLGLYWHGHTAGEQHCEKQDTTAAEKELAENAVQLAAYREQLGDANDQDQQDKQTIVSLRAAAARGSGLLCHQAYTSPLPGVPAAAASGPPADGDAPAVRGSDFDPKPALDDLSAGYEGRVEAARYALNKWPGAPAH